MKKSTKYAKKLLALFLVVLMSIESFGAIVSDNDGSAFVTKAEFDSLKNNFQTQINQYTTAIDSSVDNAIASYISGIKLEKQGTVESQIYKANEQKDVAFVKKIETPTTKIGTHYKYASHIVFARDSGLAVVPYDHTPLVGGRLFQNLISGYMSFWAYHKFKLGHGSSSFDQLQIVNKNAADNTIIFRCFKNKDNQRYVLGNQCWDITPISLAVTCAVGGGPASHKFYTSSRPDTVTLNVSGQLYDFSGLEKGQGFSNINWLWGGIDTTYQKPDPTPVCCIMDFEENVYKDATTNEVNFLCGTSVADDQLIHVGYDEEWNICDDNIFGTEDYINYAWQYYYADGTSNPGQLYTFFEERGAAGRTRGVPPLNIWMKKHREMRLNSLIHNDWTTTLNKTIKYYNGIPIFTAKDDANVKIELVFTNGDISQSADYFIRDEEFLNVDLQSSNVDVYADKDLTNRITSLTVESGSVNTTKTIYLKGKKGKTYWLKVKPSGDGTIKVTSAKTFETYTSN